MDKGAKGEAATHGQFSGIRRDASLCTPT